MMNSSSLSSFLDQAKELKILEASFLTTKELCHLSMTCKQFEIIFSKTKIEKKKVSTLLSYIFNAELKKVKEFLALQPKHNGRENCLILTRSCCKEETFLAKQKKTLFKRSWNHISPLEAAAWVGDNRILQELLLHVPLSQYKIAIDQLEGIKNRKESQENGAYLTPLRDLIKSQDEYLIQFSSFYNTYNWKKLDELWNQIFQKERLLPNHVFWDFSYLDLNTLPLWRYLHKITRPYIWAIDIQERVMLRSIVVKNLYAIQNNKLDSIILDAINDLKNFLSKKDELDEIEDSQKVSLRPC